MAEELVSFAGDCSGLALGSKPPRVNMAIKDPVEASSALFSLPTRRVPAPDDRFIHPMLFELSIDRLGQV